MAISDRSETTRRQLCLAAEALVATQGLPTATLRKVAIAAGQKNTAAVSYHFGNMEDLLRAVVDLRLRDTEAERCRMIEASGLPVVALDAFTAWRCLARPLLHLPDERAPHAHVRFLMQMSAAGMLSDPFDVTLARPDTPSITLLLARIQDLLADLHPQVGRARIALCGMMFWNAVTLYDEHALGPEPSIDLEALLEDVEGLIRGILTVPRT